MVSPRLGAAIGLAAVACGGVPDEDALYRGLGPRYEARAWLASTRNPYPFASNRFEGPAAAAAFIDSLYRLGADTVYVLNVQQDSAWLAREGGPYADAPADPPPGGAGTAEPAVRSRGTGDA
jgi:hypothetical protein